MERRRALKIPFSVEKDNLMENPFRIPMTCVSSENGKFEKQVSWTEFAGRKRRLCEAQHKNGSMLFGHNHRAKVTLEMGRRKPCLILRDILKTELGKAYLERIRRTTFGNRGQVSSTRKEQGQCKEEPIIYRDSKSSQRMANNDNKSVTPKCNQKTTSSSSQRSRHRRRLQNVDDEVDREEKDINEVVVGKDHGKDCKFAEVVDCGLSVSWEPAEDTGSCDEFSPASIDERWADPEKDVLHSLKRKRKEARSQCNGTGSPKRHRESVLRLNGDDRRQREMVHTNFCLEEIEEDGRGGGPAPSCIFLEESEGNGRGGPAPSSIFLEESGEDGDLENLDRSIVQFTVGADDPTDVLVPIISPDLEAGDSPGRDNKTSPSEPIVLSSDDEESCDVSQHCSPAVHTLVTVEDAEMQGQPPQEGKQQEASDIEDMQLLHVVVEDLPEAVSLIPSGDYSCMGVAFSTLYFGAYQEKSNGSVMIGEQEIIIPLKGISEHLEITIERKELRRYSVWEQQEMEAHELHFKCDEEPTPPAALLLYVSETAAAAIQRELLQLCVTHDETTGKASPFVLLTLRDPLEGMEGALFRSLLDIDCINSLADADSLSLYDADGFSGLEDLPAPVLSMADSIELMKRTGLDSHLLSLLGLENTDPGLDMDQEGLLSDTDSTTPLIQLDSDMQKGTVLELETERETDTQLKPEEDQNEQELELPSEKEKEEPTPVYTVCHRTTKGSYSVSLCKPDSSWTKFKHQGLAHRLIQFPPPPLKGGITVTMEDLQCLDSGQFLNDVIIDFYLKYLLYKASAAVTERSHIFSSFFYKQLTRRDNASEGNAKDSCQRQRRHQRVKTWTRHVDIFKKDFVFVPVNQEAHWYLVVICFPGLDEPTSGAWNGPYSQMEKSDGVTSELQDHEMALGPRSPSDKPETPPALTDSDNMDMETEITQEESTKEPKPGPVNCTEQTCQKKTVSKRPCILVMDSLKRSLHERVFKLLRDYLESEWEVRRGSSRDFSADQMQSSHCKVPLQDNSSDCGLYLLQYVESFLKDPVVHFDLPLHLERWFPRQQVRRKRDEIRDLVLNLYRCQNLDSDR